MNTKQKLIQILKEHKSDIDESSLTIDTKISNLGIDSLDFIEVIFSIESTFGIEIRDEQIADLQTIGDFLNCLKNNGGKP